MGYTYALLTPCLLQTPQSTFFGPPKPTTFLRTECNRVGAGVAALSLAATLQMSSVSPAIATELDVMKAPVPVGSWLLSVLQVLQRISTQNVQQAPYGLLPYM